MRRSSLLIAMLLAVLATCCWRPAAALALTADEIKVALATSTPEEEGFIQRVMAKVDKGQMPLDLVQSTFLWAKKKPKRKFQYFKYGMIHRAAELGIAL